MTKESEKRNSDSQQSHKDEMEKETERNNKKLIIIIHS
jgi:hypothetical protein